MTATTTPSTPLPRMQLVAIAFCLLTESIAATMLIPFVGLFVAFMQDWPAEKAGYASGFLIGLFMLGQVVSCKAWSTLSDHYGRKVGIVLGITGSTFATLFFGLSSNIWTCSFWRFIHGLFNGSSLISKTVISDITDRTNEAKGFMIISLMWGIGLLFGPAIGGFLYDPANSSVGNTLGVSEGSFVGRHPAFLPSLFTAIYSFIAVVIAIVTLKESNRQARPLVYAFPRTLRSKVGVFLRYIQPKLPSSEREITITGATQEAENEEIQKATLPTGIATEESPRANSQIATETSGTRKFGFKQAFQFQLTRRVLVISMLISASDMIYAETFPLWGIADVEVGGLGLKANLIGSLILVNSIPSIIANMMFSSTLKRFKDQLTFFRTTEIFYGILSFLVGFAPYFGPSAGFWFAMFIGVVRKAWESWCWSLLMMVCAQTAPKGKVGLMYAVQQASACVVRCIVPFIGAPLFAWSISGSHIFPFNHFLLFILSSIPLFISWWFTKQIFIPAQEYQWGEEPVRHSDNDVMIEPQPVAPTGFSSRSFLGSTHDVDSNEDYEIDRGLENASFSSLVTTFAMAMGPGTLQPPVMIGKLNGETEEPRQYGRDYEDEDLEVTH